MTESTQKIKNPLKVGLIAALVLVITVLHYRSGHGALGVHLLHRELYFIPILLASFWYGLNFGLVTALVISVVYAPHVFVFNDPHGSLMTVGSQVLVFNLVAVVLGVLADRQKRQQQQTLAVENMAVLGRAAAAVGQEMNELLGSLKRLTRQEGELQCTTFDHDFKQELTRLEEMIDVLATFEPKTPIHLFSQDLNTIIAERVAHFHESANKSGVRLAASLDEQGCPTRIDIQKITWVLDHLFKNALEVSKAGQTIQVRSIRGGSRCRVEIQDEGSGVRPEHLAKIFTPFFTTKDEGQGLALAGCKKIMRDFGGDIRVASQWEQGATFTLYIPREDASKSLQEQALAAGKPVAAE